MAPKFLYGDMICYKIAFVSAEAHDGPLMYVGKCGHREAVDLIDIVPLDIEGIPLLDGTYAILINHKDPSMWQLCEHLTR